MADVRFSLVQAVAHVHQKQSLVPVRLDGTAFGSVYLPDVIRSVELFAERAHQVERTLSSARNRGVRRIVLVSDLNVQLPRHYGSITGPNSTLDAESTDDPRTLCVLDMCSICL